jgi:spermidine synthase
MKAHDATPFPRIILLGAFALSGAAALSYEVVWTRALSVVLGSTTYALASMLATFMLGLAIGGIVGGRIADRRADRIFCLGLVELGIGALGIASHLIIELLPALYLSLYRTFHLAAPLYFALQIGLCSLVMVGPTVLMGMTFPIVTRAASPAIEDLGRVVGLAYGANTLGSVAGSLLAGFVLVPALGLRGATLVAAGLNLVVATGMLLRAAVGRRRAALLLALAYVPLVATALRADPPWTLVNFFTAHQYLDSGSFARHVRADATGLERVFDEETPQGHVAAFRASTGHLLVQVGGKIEGTTARDVANTLSLAYLPVAAHGAPRRMLVVGLGAGVTLAAAKRVVPDVALAEINEGVLEAVRRFGSKGVLDGVVIFRDDARHLLSATEERWDVISSEPSYPTEFAVANLFSREFYALAASRLSARGIFCQWLPYYMLSNDDVTMMVKTLATAFPHASLWKVAGSMDLLLVGSRAPMERSAADIVARVTGFNGGVPLDLSLSRSPAQIAEIAARPDVPVNTDDHPLLEFRVARNFRVGDVGLIDRPDDGGSR